MEKTFNNSKKWLLQNFFILAGILLTIINLWLATKLSPLVESIKSLEYRVTTVEKVIDQREERFIRIEDKLDTIIWSMDWNMERKK